MSSQYVNQNENQTVLHPTTTVFNTTNTSTETSEPIKETKMDVKTIATIAGVGILVLVVIIAQTIALCYFKRKAQPRRRMDNMTTRSRLDRGNQARYSAPPCRKGSKGNARAQADTDSHIYEMVGVNALYKESKELNQEVTDGTNERHIKSRPPLPLPHEIADPVPQDTLPRPKPSLLKSTLSTMSLLSNSSTLSSRKGKDSASPHGQGFMKAAPARPPKQVDELPGSLKRPPKTLPSPALAPKTGSVPKMPASDPAMLELKNMFKNRNIGNDSPAPSPTSTLEKKPPKIQAKPIKKQLKQEEPKAPSIPIGGVNPLVPPGANQIRLIIPKIEESLKSPPKTVPTPTQNVKPIPAPMKKPILPTPASQPSKPHMSHSTPKAPTPTSQPTAMSPPLSRPLPPVTHVAPSAAPAPHISPLQNRPLPIPNEASTSQPTAMSPPLSRPLPPVTHAAPSAAPAPHISPLQNRPLPTPNEAPTSQPTAMSPPLSRPLPPVTHVAPTAAPAPHISPLQNNPLPTPNEASTSRPLPPDPMPIYEMANEDESPHTDDDEEWTYEQLGQYNIYNM